MRITPCDGASVLAGPGTLGTSSDGKAEVLTVDGPLAVRDPPRPFMKNSRAQSHGGPLSRTQQGGGGLQSL